MLNSCIWWKRAKERLQRTAFYPLSNALHGIRPWPGSPASTQVLYTHTHTHTHTAHACMKTHTHTHTHTHTDRSVAVFEWDKDGLGVDKVGEEEETVLLYTRQKIYLVLLLIFCYFPSQFYVHFSLLICVHLLIFTFCFLILVSRQRGHCAAARHQKFPEVRRNKNTNTHTHTRVQHTCVFTTQACVCTTHTGKSERSYILLRTLAGI